MKTKNDSISIFITVIFFLNNEYGERIRIIHYSRYELLKIYLLALLLVRFY